MGAQLIDFTNVTEYDRDVRVPEGPYPLKIAAIDGNAKAKKSGNRMWVAQMEILAGPHKGKRIKERFVLTPEALFRLRDCLEAMGLKIGRQKIKIDPKKLVGKTLGAYVVDGEPYGQRKIIKSEIGYYMPYDEAVQAMQEADSATSVEDAVNHVLSAEGAAEADADDFDLDAIGEDDDLEDDEEGDDLEEDLEDDEPEITQEYLEGLERSELLKLAKEHGVPRKKGKRASTYVKEILDAIGGADEDDEDEEDEDVEPEGDEFDLDDI